MRTAGDVLDRLRQVFGVKNDTELAEVLGKKKNTLSTWRTRDTKPFEICEQVAKDRGLSLDWLLTGEGEMYRGTEPTAGRAPTLPAGLAVSEVRIEKLLALLAQLPPEDQNQILTDCHSRASQSQQLAELRQAVQKLTGNSTR